MSGDRVPVKSDFTPREWRIIESTRTPAQVQRRLSAIPYNSEIDKKSCLSFRGVVRENRAYCLEGAVFAAVLLEQHGYPPLVVSLESQDKLDHVLYLFRKGDRFGAIARSRCTELHGRKPAFGSVRELVMSYFDMYIDETARLIGYAVADLRELGGYDWRLSSRNIWKVERYLQEIPHHPIRSKAIDARYRKFRQRYFEFCRQHPGRQPDYYTNRHLWLL